MAGIYIHIPFCKQACTYCNFHFSTSLRNKDDLIRALLKELEWQKNFLEGESVATIYFGGGTPSLLPVTDCQLILEKIYKIFTLQTDAEITLEANPDDISKEKLSGWKAIGINRLSIGIQSFFEEELQWMNRAHNVQQSYQCMELCQASGFNNLSIDLIYGSPLLTDEMWEQNVSAAVQFNIPHLSCYALTVEEKTPLHKKIALHQTENIDADKQARQFLLLMKWLRESGYEHYEVSNFAKPGFRSRHNSSYWKGGKYLGAGPSAHSYNGILRKWNIANNSSYINNIINKGIAVSESEILTPEQQLNEYIMIALRTSEGMDLERIKKDWGAEKVTAMEKKLTVFKNYGLITQNNSVVCLTDDGMLMADGIAADLFVMNTPVKVT
jgi:oxygen-independent coproporphyrinogen-3 oxidase